MNFLFLTFVIVTISIVLNIGLVLYIFTKNFRPLLNKVLIIQILGMSAWSISIATNLWLHSDIIEMFIFGFAAISLTAQLWFTTIFPSEKQIQKRKKYALAFFSIVGLSFTAISFIPGAVFTSIEVTSTGYTIVDPGFLSGAFAFFVFSSIAISITMLTISYVYATDTHIKNQAKFLLIGFALFFICTLFTNSILPVFFDIYFFNAIGPVFSVILVAGIVYIMTYHQFLETRELAQTGFVYTILLSFVLLLYVTALSVSSYFFQANFQLSQFVSCLSVTLIALFTVPKIDYYLRKKTDPFFFEEKYDYQEALHTLSSVMHDSLEMDTLLTTAENTLQDILQSTSVSITQGHSVADTDVRAIPIELTKKRIGTIILGPKKSGAIYSPRDLQLLRTFAHQAAIAIGRVLLYAEVKKRAKELEEKVMLRTQSIKKIQEDQKTAMLHISHNLQTPLTILQTKIEKLNEIPGMQKTAQGLNLSMHHMSIFINDLLRYARIEGNAEEFKKQNFDLSGALQELIEEYEIIANTKNARIVSTIEPNIQIYADQPKIGEVITNLVSNALKYTDTLDGPTVHVSLSRGDTNMAVCTITDNGLGIDEKELGLIFEQYYRIGTNEVDGTGLGLAISKQIVIQHGGSIDVKSALGTGTTFTVKLPLA